MASTPVNNYITAAYSKGANGNFGVETPELDVLIQKTNAEPNDEQQAKLHREMGKYVYDNYLMVPIAVKNSIGVLSQRVGDWPVTKG